MSCILCVDDDQVGLRIRMAVLESFGFEVHGASEPDEAIRLLRSRDFDLAVVDYFLGKTTGTQLARSLKLQHPALLVLLLSGTVDAPDGIEHVDGFLCKTDTPQGLATTIRDLIDTHRFRAA